MSIHYSLSCLCVTVACVMCHVAGGAEPTESLLTGQSPDGEIAGWKSYHDGEGAKTGTVWILDKDGVLVCKGQPKGYLLTEKTHGDVVMSFEWRWPPGGKAGNGGVLLRKVGVDKIWPKSLEVQLNASQAGDLWAIGGFQVTGPEDRSKTMDHETFGRLIHVRRLVDVEKPVGQWNEGEISLVGGNISVRMNGKLVNEATGCEAIEGNILLTAEGNEIHFRNLRLSDRMIRQRR